MAPSSKASLQDLLDECSSLRAPRLFPVILRGSCDVLSWGASLDYAQRLFCNQSLVGSKLHGQNYLTIDKATRLSCLRWRLRLRRRQSGSNPESCPEVAPPIRPIRSLGARTEQTECAKIPSKGYRYEARSSR